jgi:cysteine desulfurase
MTRLPLVYLDHNATGPVCPEAKAAMAQALDLPGNPSSIHRAGRAARAIVEDAREAVAQLAGANPGDVIFTGSGTEANALALRGLSRAMGCSAVVCSAVEHSSVIANMTDIDSFLPVDANGVLDLAMLERRLSTASAPLLVSVMLANNETGIIQPVAEIARIVHAAKGYVHCDAIQGPGRMAFSLDGLGVDAVSLSAHKFGGPKGVGALVLRPGLRVTPIFEGGGQEKSRRSGTENVPGIAGMGAAAKAVPKLLARAEPTAQLRERVEARILQAVSGAVVHGKAVARLPNTICVSVPRVASQTQVIQLDLAGVCVSTGSACSSGKVSLSHVLKAMNVPDDQTSTAIRVSFGADSTDADANAFLAAYLPIATGEASQSLAAG